jgi:flagellar basal-body rod modification protein FlgD
VWAPVESVSLPSGGDPVLSVSGIGPVKISAVRSAG